MASNEVDGRGSKDQRTIFDMLRDLYPKLEIVYEFPLHDLNQRLDLFIPSLGIAVEYDGIQHDQFVPFFHKEFEDYKKGRDYDQQKLEYLTKNGIKLVRIKHNKMVKSPEELKELIDSVEYPPFEYTGLESKNLKKQEQLDKDREYRRNIYKKIKESKNKS